MRRAIGLSAAVLVGGVGLAGSGSAIEIRFPGSDCVARDSAEMNKVRYEQKLGVRNVSTTASAAVACGAVVQSAATISLVTFTAYDRSTTADVCCVINVQNSNGTAAATSTKCTSGFATLEQTPSFSLPSATQAFIASLECTIPPTNANGDSIISSVRVQ